ncbi:hypothetical protein [Clostridium aciditolerans]|uniref:Peptidoglycan binding-like domain-containing protein n=1 Tax=Clostridium aciditolerans TaxID=339861 RepID=A0A934M547_9CLOT|nr:hypothetical protein [Clostridium aciditolerans]MBI6874710.1 hypothetical protein [Clostridium aciditolerans]
MKKDQLFMVSSTDIDMTLEIDSVCLQQIIAKSKLTQFIYSYSEISSELINLNNRKDIIEYIETVLNNNLKRKIINTSLSKTRLGEKAPKKTLDFETSKNFSSFDTMLAVRNFQKKNHMSSCGKMDMQIFNKLNSSELNHVEETR